MKLKPESKVNEVFLPPQVLIISTDYIIYYNFQQWMSWIPQRWRTQRNVIRNANCRTSWIIKILNAHCTFGSCPRVYSSECPLTPLSHDQCENIGCELDCDSVWFSLTLFKSVNLMGVSLIRGCQSEANLTLDTVDALPCIFLSELFSCGYLVPLGHCSVSIKVGPQH